MAIRRMRMRRYRRRRYTRPRRRVRRTYRRRNNYRRNRRFRTRGTKVKVFHILTDIETTDEATGEYSRAYTVALANGIGYANYASLYDYYKITKWVIKIVPEFDNNNIGSYGTTGFHSDSGRYITCIDHNDAVSPLSYAYMQTYANARESRGTSIQTRVIKPSILAPKYYTTQGGEPVYQNGPEWNTWLNTANAYTVPHFGFKIFAVTETPQYPLRFRIVSYFNVIFKGERNAYVSSFQGPSESDLGPTTGPLQNPVVIPGEPPIGEEEE